MVLDGKEFEDYGMKAKKSSIYEMVFIAVIFCLVLSGCDQLPIGKSVSTEVPVSVESTSTEAATTETVEPLSPYSIAAKDWEIKNHPVGGTDNLYELFIDELDINYDEYFVALRPLGEQFLFVKLNHYSEAAAYVVDPLTMEVTASCDLPAGTYSYQGVSVNSQEQIEIWNGETHEFFVFDRNLNEQERISLGDINTSRVVLSDDRKYAYYIDYADGGIYCHQISDGTRMQIFSDVHLREDDFGEILGLFMQDSCLAFYYSNGEEEGIVYEVRKIDSGASLYRNTAMIDDIETTDEGYVLRYYEDGISDIVFGNYEDEMPQVLALMNYSEYDMVNADIRSKSVVSCQMIEGAEGIYQELVDKRQADQLDGDEETVTLLTVNQYDLESGKRKHSMDFYYVRNDGQYLSSCNTVYLKETDCMVCMLEGSASRWLVWDLTKDSSKTGDETNYIYNWQNPDVPDEELMLRLKDRAEQIGRENGVEVYIGEEVTDCPQDIYGYEISTNAVRIAQMLNLLEKALKKYPDGMLEQLGKDSEWGSCLHIYLAGGIFPLDETGIDAIGVQNTLDGITFLVLDINSIYDLENTIYHEIFHAIENFINYDEDAFFDEMVWNDLNPDGFTYDFDYQLNEQSDNFDYTVERNQENAYFIDLYSKSFPNEDRARVMEYAMLDTTDIRHKNVESPGVQAKLKYICGQIRKGFDTTGWPEKTVWEMAVTE